MPHSERQAWCIDGDATSWSMACLQAVLVEHHQQRDHSRVGASPSADQACVEIDGKSALRENSLSHEKPSHPVEKQNCSILKIEGEGTPFTAELMAKVPQCRVQSAASNRRRGDLLPGCAP